MKRIICLIITLSMLLSVTPVMAAGLEWKETKDDVPIFPLDNYYSRQNSPSFSWPYVSDATYEIVLANDKELTDIAYREEGLKYNVFTFSYKLEADKIYYWSIRYKIGSSYSEWLEPRRIYIAPDAYEFVAPDVSGISELANRPKPLFLTPEKVAAIAKIDQTQQGFIDFKRNVDSYVNTNQFDDGHLRNTAASGDMDENAILTPVNRIYATTLMYYVTGEEKYLSYALRAIEVIKDLDPSKMFEWGPTTDTAEANFTYKFAMAYDMLYNYMDDKQREMSVKLMERVFSRPFYNHAKGGALEESIYHIPFVSHRWGIIKCVLAGIVIYNESEMARKFVETYLPMFCFTTNMNSQSIQDGGSHHGMFYGLGAADIWKSATDAGVANLAGKAHEANKMINMIYQWPIN